MSQYTFDALEYADVAAKADHTPGFAAGVADFRLPREHPANTCVPANHLVLTLEAGGLAWQAIRGPCADACTIDLVDPQ